MSAQERAILEEDNMFDLEKTAWSEESKKYFEDTFSDADNALIDAKEKLFNMICQVLDSETYSLESHMERNEKGYSN